MRKVIGIRTTVVNSTNEVTQGQRSLLHTDDEKIRDGFTIKLINGKS